MKKNILVTLVLAAIAVASYTAGDSLPSSAQTQHPAAARGWWHSSF